MLQLEQLFDCGAGWTVWCALQLPTDSAQARLGVSDTPSESDVAAENTILEFFEERWKGNWDQATGVAAARRLAAALSAVQVR